jgi:hypothetical protein
MEAKMKTKSITIVVSFVSLLGSLFASGPTLADTMDCSGSKEAVKEITAQSIKPGDQPGRELAQVERVDIIYSDNPELNNIEVTVYLHFDQVGATGDHSGYAVWNLNSGEKVWVKFNGTHYFVPKGEGDWETPYLGSMRFIAGTGKYKAIRGGGYYKGKGTPAGAKETLVCSAEY